MKKIFLISICVILAFLFLDYQNSNSKDTIAKLMDYDSKYVGDASAVGNILTLLEIRYSSFKLTTSCKPYGIQVFCMEQKPEKKKDLLKKANLYNSVIIFSLIQNVDEIKWSYDNGLEFSFRRTEVDDFFGQNLEAFGNDRDKWEKQLLDKLNIEKLVDSFYSRYNVLKQSI
jgi:hypothetical protein